MGFQGYSRDLRSYFVELGDNNNKAWFDENRGRFDSLIMEPTVQLVAGLAEPLSQLNPALRAEPKVNKSIRRIYRDTRFSKDKTPYHTHLHLVFWAGGHPNKSPGLHVILGANGFVYGAGHWGFAPEQLDAYRADILDDEGKGVAAAVDAACAKGLELDPPALARVPNGFDKDHRWAGWARYKGLVVKSPTVEMPAPLFGAEGVDFVAELAREVAPLNRYIMEHVYSG
jgi:uncharacterized protein (TIGR02453 family)